MPRIEYKAIEIVSEALRRQKFEVLNVSTNREHKGFDILAKKGRKKLRVEVKACSRLWQIPDPFSTEFTEDKKLVADVLWIVYFDGKRRPIGDCQIPRKAIPADMVVKKWAWRFRSGFKKESVLKKYFKKI